MGVSQSRSAGILQGGLVGLCEAQVEGGFGLSVLCMWLSKCTDM
jgi:hypothetical protein